MPFCYAGTAAEALCAQAMDASSHGQPDGGQGFRNAPHCVSQRGEFLGLFIVTAAGTDWRIAGFRGRTALLALNEHSWRNALHLVEMAVYFLRKSDSQ